MTPSKEAEEKWTPEERAINLLWVDYVRRTADDSDAFKGLLLLRAAVAERDSLQEAVSTMRCILDSLPQYSHEAKAPDACNCWKSKVNVSEKTEEA